MPNRSEILDQLREVFDACDAAVLDGRNALAVLDDPPSLDETEKALKALTSTQNAIVGAGISLQSRIFDLSIAETHKTHKELRAALRSKK